MHLNPPAPTILFFTPPTILQFPPILNVPISLLSKFPVRVHYSSLYTDEFLGSASSIAYLDYIQHPLRLKYDVESCYFPDTFSIWTIQQLSHDSVHISHPQLSRSAVEKSGLVYTILRNSQFSQLPNYNYTY